MRAYLRGAEFTWEVHKEGLTLGPPDEQECGYESDHPEL